MNVSQTKEARFQCMKDDPKILNYLTQLKVLVQNVIMTLPKNVSGRVYIRENYVHIDLQGPRLGIFTLVLGSEAPELIYDDRYIGFRMIPEGLDKLIEFTEETMDDVATFILSAQPLADYKSTLLRRSYVCIPSNYGPEWKLKRFR